MDNGKIKTRLTYWLRKDVRWSDGVQFTAEDYQFTCWYMYAHDTSWYWLDFADVHHVEIIDEYQVDVYMDLQSIWSLYWPIGPLLPRHVWLQNLASVLTEDFVEGEDVSTPGEVPLSGNPVWVEYVNVHVPGHDWEALERYSEWNIIKGKLTILKDLPEGTEVSVRYWKPDDNSGQTPGGLPAEEILIGCGMFKIHSFDDNGFYVDCNSAFFLDTPPLGEVDWHWVWEGTVKPRNGWYQINIYDATRVTGAYCQRGDGDPALYPDWFPGGDIDSTDIGHIGLYDVVCVLNNYGQKFGQPPP